MKILIEDLSFFTILGILEHERIVPQRVSCVCHIDYNYCENVFIDYADVARLIEQTMNIQQFELIEEALIFLGELLKKTFPSIYSLSLTLYKPDILSNCTVGVQEIFHF